MRLLAVLLTFVSALPAFAADLPTGDSLLARFAEVTGGESAWAKVRTAVMDGAIDMAGRNFVGNVQIVEQGEKSYMSMEFSGIGKVEECYNGVDAWEVSAVSGPRLIEGDEKASIRRASSISILTGWRNLYSKATTLRAEDIEGHPAWRVEMIPKQRGSRRPSGSTATRACSCAYRPCSAACSARSTLTFACRTTAKWRASVRRS
jgi:hypothetical protein